MKRVLIFGFAMLAGCGGSMTNDQIIAETKKCNDAGLRAELVNPGFQLLDRGVGRNVACGKRIKNWVENPDSFAAKVKDTLQ